jgi:hypothetical protein
MIAVVQVNCRGANVLFSLKPKENRSELFGRNREVDELKRLIARKSTIVVMTGIKRIGKRQFY